MMHRTIPILANATKSPQFSYLVKTFFAGVAVNTVGKVLERVDIKKNSSEESKKNQPGY